MFLYKGLRMGDTSMYRNYDKLDVGSLMVSFKMFMVCNKYS